MAYQVDDPANGSGGGGGWSVDVPGADDPWWEDAINFVLDLFGSEFPKDLPPPLPFGWAPVAEMLDAMPSYRRALREAIERQGHTHLYLGRDPTPADLDNVATLAELGVWFANGTGDDFSRGEATIRRIIIEGMRAYAASPDPGGGGTPPGGGGGYPDAGAPPTLEGAGGLALAAGAGWILWELFQAGR